jgi:hypothetical protein
LNLKLQQKTQEFEDYAKNLKLMKHKLLTNREVTDKLKKKVIEKDDQVQQQKEIIR